jgi:hypothetical protein
MGLIRQPEAVIEPRETLERIGLAALAQHLPVNLTGNTIRMIDVRPRCGGIRE